MAIADAYGDVDLRVFVRRAACMVLGTSASPDWAEWLQESLALSIAAGDGWQEAISRNDLACWHQREGRLAEAEAEIARGLAVARRSSATRFALGVLHSTRSDIRLLAGRADEARADAERAIAAPVEQPQPNPYVFGVTVRARSRRWPRSAGSTTRSAPARARSTASASTCRTPAASCSPRWPTRCARPAGSRRPTRR